MLQIHHPHLTQTQEEKGKGSQCSMHLMFQAETVMTNLCRRRMTTVVQRDTDIFNTTENTLESSSNGKLYIMCISQLKGKGTNTYDSIDKI